MTYSLALYVIKTSRLSNLIIFTCLLLMVLMATGTSLMSLSGSFRMLKYTFPNAPVEKRDMEPVKE